MSILLKLLKRASAWALLSSSNPSKFSLTVKSALVWGVTALTMIAGFSHIHLPGPEAFTEAIDAIVAFIQAAFLFISTATGAWGAIRKVWSSISGNNAVVNYHPAFTE